MPLRAPLIAVLLASSLATSAMGPASAAARPAVAEPAGDQPANSAGVGTDVVVEFRADLPVDRRTRALAARGLELVDEVEGSDFVVARPTDPAGRKSSATGGADDEVVDVDPVVLMRAAAAPNDFLYPMQWHLPMVQAPRAWDVSTGKGAVVAVIDSGVAYRTSSPHVQAPDLVGATFTRPKDFVDGDLFPDDLNGHGTHVAGTIAQVTGNGIGTAGLAPGATIMPIRVLDADGLGTDAAIASALRYAADNGAHVANLSLGGSTATSVLADAVTYATNKGMTIVAASGNDGEGSVGYPAAYPQVIAVGAVRSDRLRASYANYGSALDIVAPGGDEIDRNGDGYPDGILQQTLFDGPGDFCFCLLTGTSMATPQVAAAAALLVAEGTRTPTAVRSALEGSALDLGVAGRDDQYGHGLLQARSALDRVGALAKPDFVPGRTARSIDGSCPIERVFRGTFDDVQDADPHARAIDCVSWWSVARGVTPSAYRPAQAVTREQMATFIANVIIESGYTLPVSPPDAFTDDDASAHEHRIDQLAAVGIIVGAGGGRYRPEVEVSREALATYLVKTHDWITRTPLPAAPDYFTDDTTSTHRGNIDKATAVGLISGTGTGTYTPGGTLRRNQMASFLARLLDLLVDSGATVASS